MTILWGRWAMVGARKNTYGRWHILDASTAGRPMSDGGEKTLCGDTFERWDTTTETPRAMAEIYGTHGAQTVCSKCSRKAGLA